MAVPFTWARKGGGPFTQLCGTNAQAEVVSLTESTCVNASVNVDVLTVSKRRRAQRGLRETSCGALPAPTRLAREGAGRESKRKAVSLGGGTRSRAGRRCLPTEAGAGLNALSGHHQGAPCKHP